MPIQSMFFDAEEVGGVYDREYSAGDFSRYLDEIVGNGVFPNPSTQLQVRASTGLNIVVGSGQGWISGHKLILTADLPLELDSADALLTRMDRIVMYCDYTNREMGIEVKKGTPSATPAAPALVRTDSRYELSLAVITIAKQKTSITNAEIQDTRADTTVCGWVTGLIDQVDTSTLYQQWQSAYEQYYDDTTTDFNSYIATTKQQLDDFMETLTEELNVNTFVKKFHQHVSGANANLGYKYININISGYTYNATDIFDVYINGVHAEEGIGYTLYTEGPSGTAQIPVTYPCILLTWAAELEQEVDIVITKSVIGIENL